MPKLNLKKFAGIAGLIAAGLLVAAILLLSAGGIVVDQLGWFDGEKTVDVAQQSDIDVLTQRIDELQADGVELSDLQLKKLKEELQKTLETTLITPAELTEALEPIKDQLNALESKFGGVSASDFAELKKSVDALSSRGTVLASATPSAAASGTPVTAPPADPPKAEVTATPVNCGQPSEDGKNRKGVWLRKENRAQLSWQNPHTAVLPVDAMHVTGVIPRCAMDDVLKCYGTADADWSCVAASGKDRGELLTEEEIDRIYTKGTKAADGDLTLKGTLSGVAIRCEALVHRSCELKVEKKPSS